MQPQKTNKEIIKEQEKKWNTTKRKEVIEKTFTPIIQEILFDVNNSPLKPIKNINSQFITGDTNKGKTIYAAFLLLEAHKQWYLKTNNLSRLQNNRYLMVSFPAILRELKQTYSDPTKNEYDVMDKYVNAEILIIDDWGVSKLTEWVYEVFYYLINSRYEHKRTTIITSNSDIETLSKNWDDRILRRIISMCNGKQIDFKGYKGNRIKDKQT